MSEEEIKKNQINFFKASFLAKLRDESSRAINDFMYAFYYPYQNENIRENRKLLVEIGAITAGLSGLSLNFLNDAIRNGSSYMLSGILGLFLTSFFSFFAAVFLSQKNQNILYSTQLLILKKDQELNDVIDKMELEVDSITGESFENFARKFKQIKEEGSKRWSSIATSPEEPLELDYSSDLIILLLTISFVLIISDMAKLSAIWFFVLFIIPFILFVILQTNSWYKYRKIKKI